MAREKAIIRPATADDVAEYARLWLGSEAPLYPRMRGFAGVVGDKVVAIGGIAFWPCGTRQAFCDLSPEARLYPITMHRAALMTIEMARRLGFPRILAEARGDGVDNAVAERWLLRLGFQRHVKNDQAIFIWQK